jgi:hypothetical protein
MVLSPISTLPLPHLTPDGGEVSKEEEKFRKNVQGDIMCVIISFLQRFRCTQTYRSVGISKRFEDFIFLVITNPETFRKQLGELVPYITTAHDVLHLRQEIQEAKKKAKESGTPMPLLQCRSTTIGFSAEGVRKVRPSVGHYNIKLD